MLDDNFDLNKIKVCDFGTAGPYNKTSKRSVNLGSPYYMAPEILSGKYNEKCDLWSVGVITFEILCGKVPFDGKTLAKIYDRIRLGSVIMMGPRWDKVTSEAKHFVMKLLNRDFENRMSA